MKETEFIKQISYQGLSLCSHLITYFKRTDLKNNEFLTELVQIVQVPRYPFFDLELAKVILYISPKNNIAINILKRIVIAFANNSYEFLSSLSRCADYIVEEREVFDNLINFIDIRLHEQLFYDAMASLKSVKNKSKMVLVINKISHFFVDDNFLKYNLQVRDSYELFWEYSSILNYPDFYCAWHNHLLSKDNINIQPYPISINTENLNLEADEVNLLKRFKLRLMNSLPKEIKSQISESINNQPQSSEITANSLSYEIESFIMKIKEELQIDDLTLFLNNSEPSQLLLNIREQFSDIVQIEWNC